MKRPLIIRRVHGHSMVPVLPPGTLVIGWGWFSRLRPMDIIIFEHDGKEKIKRVTTINVDGSLEVLGDHAETSTDSRQFGSIERKYVQAKMIWPRQPRE